MKDVYLLVVLLLIGAEIYSVQSQIEVCATPELGTPCVIEGATIAVSCKLSAFLYCTGGQYTLAECREGYEFTDGKCVGNVDSGSDDGSIVSANCVNNNYYTFAYPGISTYYYYCYNNEALMAQCPPNTYYSTAIQACSSTDPTPISQICLSSGAQFLPDSSDCRNYIRCVNGLAFTLTCPTGLYYDSIEQGCGPTIPTSCSDASGNCIGNQIRADPTSCQNYIQCIGGQSYVKSCPSGLYYDSIAGGCGPTMPASCDITTPIEACTGQLMVDPTNCRKYYYCVDDNKVSGTCPSNYYFHPTTQNCGPVAPAGCSTIDPSCTPGKKDPDASNCQAYYICIGGVTQRAMCGTGQYFDPQSLSCGTTIPSTCIPTTPTCIEDTMSQDITNCQRYYICKNGNKLLATCSTGQFFYPPTQSCGALKPSGCVLPATCQENQLTPNPVNCRQYYLCKNGENTVYSCPGGYYFNTINNMCGPVAPASCTRPNLIATCSLSGNTLIADPANCHRFISCVNGQQNSYSCPNNLYFNPTTGSCTSTVPATCRTSQSIIITCPSNLNINVPDMNNCQNYYLCYSGTSYSMSCEAGLYYDIESSGCLTTIPTRCNGIL